MFDLRVIHSVLDQMEEERGVSREKMLDAIEQSLATAYKKEYGKRGQIIRTNFDLNTGTTTFNQIKIVVDESMIRPEEEGEDEDTEKPKAKETKPQTDSETEEGEVKVRFDPEKHIMIDNAKLIKKDVVLNEELIFPLESKDDFGRIAAQTAKQVIMQKIREAEKESAIKEFGEKAGDILLGHVQRFERGNLYIDLGRVTGVMPYDEQIPGERFRPGERIRVLLLSVDETPRGIFLKLTRSHPDFLEKLFAIEAPELQSGAVVMKAIAREAGSRSKIAVFATDSHIDPVGSLVGQRGVRVSTVMSELGGEKIDIIEWSEDPQEFIEDSLSPAQVMNVTILEKGGEDENLQGHAEVEVASDQQSLAIGRGGQNVRLAAKLTGWKIDITSLGGEEDLKNESSADEDVIENESATTTKPEVETDEDTKDRDVPEDTEEADEIDTPEEAEKELAPALDKDVVEEIEETKVEEEKSTEETEEEKK